MSEPEDSPEEYVVHIPENYAKHSFYFDISEANAVIRDLA